MRKRLTIGLAAGLLAAAMLPGAAQAGEEACTVHGTKGDDRWATAPHLSGLLIPEDAIVCGGAGNDFISGGLYGTFYGGPGDDLVDGLVGVFEGGSGDDIAIDVTAGGSFYGGPGADRVEAYLFGDFDGGPGDDFVNIQRAGHFEGGPGYDQILWCDGGTRSSIELQGQYVLC